MPQPHIVSAFATALTERLPGEWYRKYEGFPPPKGHQPVAARAWDCGPSRSALLDFPDTPVALLHGPDDEQLCVIERPRYPRQYLIAPLKPEGFKPHHFRDVDEPGGIAVPNDPVRAAAAVARRVLPRFHRALDAVHHNARVEPEPPHRPAAPEVAETLTLVWYPDGVVGAPYASVPAEARTVLYSCYFQYSPHEAAFVLPASYSTSDRALLIQTAVRLLTAQGIGVNFRHATPTEPRASRPAVASPGMPPPAAAPAAARR